MAMSGITVSCECEEAHDRQHKKKDIQWTIYKIGDDEHAGHQHMQQQSKGAKPKGSKQAIMVDCQRDRSFNADHACHMGCKDDVVAETQKLWEEFVEALPDNEGRYAVFDYVQPTKSGTFTDKMRFIAWSPDTANVKSKMIYSSTKDSLKKKLDVPKELFLSSKSADDIKEGFNDLMSEM